MVSRNSHTNIVDESLLVLMVATLVTIVTYEKVLIK